MNILRSSKLLIAAAPLLLSAQVYATTESVAVNVEFVTPIALTEVATLSFGLIDSGITTQTITVGTDDTPGGTTALIVGGAQTAAEVTIVADVGQAIHIDVSHTGSPTGYSLGTFVCRYNGGSDGDCETSTGLAVASTVASAPVEIGATLTGATPGGAAVEDSTIDVVVTYD